MCSAALVPGVDRCVACGAVWGEDNRCPHCHALAAVRPDAGGYVCVACSKPREKKPGTTVLSGGPGAAGIVPGGDRVVLARGASVGLRLVGVVSIAGGLLLAAGVVALFGTGAGGLLAAAAIGGLGVGLGALALRGGSRASRGADATQAAAREQLVFDLAAKKDGVLTVTDLVRELGMSSADADATLTNLADGSRVSAEITTDGRVQYEFRELRSVGGVLPVRARVQDLEAVELEEAMAEVEEALGEGKA